MILVIDMMSAFVAESWTSFLNTSKGKFQSHILEKSLTVHRKMETSSFDVGLIQNSTLIKKKRKFSSYIRKFRGIGCNMNNDLLTYGENICAFPHILESPSSYMTLHSILSEVFFI